MGSFTTILHSDQEGGAAVGNSLRMAFQDGNTAVPIGALPVEEIKQPVRNGKQILINP